MGYFFGGQPNGTSDPSLITDPNLRLAATMTNGVMPSGRDTQQVPAPAGLMAGKTAPDGSNAAYDMKSLGKHIEAVSNNFCLFLTSEKARLTQNKYVHLDSDRKFSSFVPARRYGNESNSESNRDLLQYREANNSGPSAESRDAPFSKSLFSTSPESPCGFSI